MDIKRPLTVLAAITTLVAFAIVTEGRPETNFAGSSISSDGSGTRSTQYVGSIPNNGGGGGGVGVGTGSGSGSGGGITVVSGSGPGTGQGSVGIFSRSGPGGTQHTVIGPQGTRVYNQPPSYTYPIAPGYYNDHYDYYSGYNYNYPPPRYNRPAVAVAGPNGASASAGGVGTFAGPGGSGVFTGAGSGSPDYYG